MCCPASTSAGRNIPRVRLAYLSPPQYHTTILYFLLHSYYRHDFSHDSSPAEKSAGCLLFSLMLFVTTERHHHHHPIIIVQPIYCWLDMYAHLFLFVRVIGPVGCYLSCTSHTPVPDSLLMHQTPYTLIFVSRVQLYSPILYISHKKNNQRVIEVHAIHNITRCIYMHIGVNCTVGSVPCSTHTAGQQTETIYSFIFFTRSQQAKKIQFPRTKDLRGWFYQKAKKHTAAVQLYSVERLLTIKDARAGSSGRLWPRFKQMYSATNDEHTLHCTHT